MISQKQLLEFCEMAYQEYSRPHHIIRPYLQDLVEKMDQKRWEESLIILDELEELLDLDLSSSPH